MKLLGYHKVQQWILLSGHPSEAQALDSGGVLWDDTGKAISQGTPEAIPGPHLSFVLSLPPMKSVRTVLPPSETYIYT